MVTERDWDAPVQYRNSQGPPRLGFHSCFRARSGLPGKMTLRCGTRGGTISTASATISGSKAELCEIVEAMSILNNGCVRLSAFKRTLRRPS